MREIRVRGRIARKKLTKNFTRKTFASIQKVQRCFVIYEKYFVFVSIFFEKNFHAKIVSERSSFFPALLLSLTSTSPFPLIFYLSFTLVLYFYTFTLSIFFSLLPLSLCIISLISLYFSLFLSLSLSLFLFIFFLPRVLSVPLFLLLYLLFSLSLFPLNVQGALT